MKTAVRLLVAAVTLVGLALAMRSAVSTYQSTARQTDLRPELGFLVAAAVLYAVSLLPAGWVLHRTAGALGLPATLRQSIAAQLLGHLGKYVPGKAVVVVLRVEALTTNRTQVAAATIAVFVETLSMMAVGAAVAGVLAIQMPLPFWVRLLIGAIAIAGTVGVSPPLLRLVLTRLAHARRLGGVQLDHINWRLVFSGWFGQLVAWLLIGGSMTCIVVAFEGDVATTFAPATVAISLGMVLGFVSLLPGGAGVREWITLLVLTPATGPAIALLSVVVARLLFIAVESIAAAAAWWWLRKTVVRRRGSRKAEKPQR